ncbi:hypothetical protein V5O48_018927, partial [Marasmius crinis-equi]
PLLLQTSALIPSTPASDAGAEYYNAGLPGQPRLVARTSTTPWEALTGPDGFRILKELRRASDNPV